MVKILTALFFLPVILHAQTVLITTNNIFDLDPARDAVTANQGNIRIRHTVTDGVAPVDVSLGLPIRLSVASRIDGYTNNIVSTAASDGLGVVWWVLPFLNAGEYELKSSVTLPNDTFEIFDRFLTVTSAPPAETSITVSGIVVEANTIITNVVSSALNIYYWGTNVASVTNGP